MRRYLFLGISFHLVFKFKLTLKIPYFCIVNRSIAFRFIGGRKVRAAQSTVPCESRGLVFRGQKVQQKINRLVFILDKGEKVG